jgi:hypothetical protein
VLGLTRPVAAAADGVPVAETVATGLDNPRGLVLLGQHKLAVAEAGHAGTVCLGPGQCLGLNGQVTVVGLGERERTVLASGLASFSGPFGAFGLGGLTLQDGKLYFLVRLNPLRRHLRLRSRAPAEQRRRRPAYHPKPGASGVGSRTWSVVRCRQAR